MGEDSDLANGKTESVVGNPNDKPNKNIYISKIEKLSQSLIINKSHAINTNLDNFYTPDIFKIRNNIEPSGTELSELFGLCFEFNTFISWNFPKEDIQPWVLNKLNNKDLGIYYQISDKFKFGFDLKQETFYLKYSSIEKDSKSYIIRTQPNFTTYNLNFRYYPMELGFTQPFAQFGVGYNKYGLIIRPKLGLEYKGINNFSLLLGAEYANLFFNHQKIWNASKVSIYWGLGYSF